MSEDDDALAAYDLSAWDAPAPPAGLADAVIARAKQPPAAGAVEAIEHGPPRAPIRHRWWVAAIAAAAVASGALALWTLRTPAAHRTVVEQRDGAGDWAVGSDDELAIIAGGGFATIEASGARLRVEVTKVNATDPRVLGTSAATAALVAMITVVVYDGHATVVHDGRTQEVAAGSTLQVGAAPPQPGAPAVGTSEDLRLQIARQEAQIALLQAQLDQARLQVAGGAPPPKVPAKTAPAAKPAPSANVACDADALSERGRDLLAQGSNAKALTQFEQSLACKSDAYVTRLAYMAACKAQNATKARMYYRAVPPADRGPLAQLCIREGITLDNEPYVPVQQGGQLVIECTPNARVWIDGLDTGSKTPMSLPVVAGKHKVTFQLGGDRYTYSVVVQPNETAVLSKVLQ